MSRSTVRRLGLAVLGLLITTSPMVAAVGKTGSPSIRVYIEDPYTRDAARRAVDLASQRLSVPACQSLVWEFQDMSGRPLGCYAYPDRIGRPYLDVGPKANAAVTRALQLDDRLALAHAVAGTIRWRIDYDPVAAEPHLQRAMALNPSSTLVLVPAAEFLMWRGDPDRGIPLLTRAVRTDPQSPDVWTRAGFDLLMVGRYDAASEHFRRALQLDSRYATASLWLAETYTYLSPNVEKRPLRNV